MLLLWHNYVHKGIFFPSNAHWVKLLFILFPSTLNLWICFLCNSANNDVWYFNRQSLCVQYFRETWPSLTFSCAPCNWMPLVANTLSPNPISHASMQRSTWLGYWMPRFSWINCIFFTGWEVQLCTVNWVPSWAYIILPSQGYKISFPFFCPKRQNSFLTKRAL